MAVSLMEDDAVQSANELSLVSDADEQQRVRSVSGLPKAFRQFLEDNGISEESYTSAFKYSHLRYIRLSKDSELSFETLKHQLPDIIPVSWCPSFYSLPHRVPVASSQAYREGHIYGMDVSSAAAVLSLQVQPGENCLDLCCAPGAKLCMLSELCTKLGTVTGVDIIRDRLASCRSMLIKYKRPNVRLFLADGVTFANGPPSLLKTNDGEISGLEIKPLEKHSIKDLGLHSKKKPKRAKLPKRDRRYCVSGMFFCSDFLLKSLELSDNRRYLYDKVLVDAECTHDGSIKHIIKYNEWGWETFEKRFLDPERVSTLESLQRGLIQNGFSLLRAGGRLVYSTCSFCKRQNEDIVEWLLDTEPSAQLVSAELPLEAPVIHPSSKRLHHCVKLTPKDSGTSGLFIACITKRFVETS
eukprot:gene9394-1641_t